MQAEQGQLPKNGKEDTHGVIGQNNHTETRVGDTSVRNAEKAGQ